MRDKKNLAILQMLAGQSDSLITNGTYKEVLATMRDCGYEEINFEQDGSNFASTYGLSNGKMFVVEGNMSDATIHTCSIDESVVMPESKIDGVARTKVENLMLVDGVQLNGGKDAQTFRNIAGGIISKYNEVASEMYKIPVSDYVVSGDVLLEHGVDLESDATKVLDYMSYDDVVIGIHESTGVEVTEDDIDLAMKDDKFSEGVFSFNYDAIIESMKANGVVFSDED